MNSIADVHRQLNPMHTSDIKLKPFHKQLVKIAAPEFMRDVFEKALALHLPDMFALRARYQVSYAAVILKCMA
jgi:hypothetical protein